MFTYYTCLNIPVCISVVPLLLRVTSPPVSQSPVTVRWPFAEHCDGTKKWASTAFPGAFSLSWCMLLRKSPLQRDSLGFVASPWQVFCTENQSEPVFPLQWRKKCVHRRERAWYLLEFEHSYKLPLDIYTERAFLRICHFHDEIVANSWAPRTIQHAATTSFTLAESASNKWVDSAQMDSRTTWKQICRHSSIGLDWSGQSTQVLPWHLPWCKSAKERYLAMGRAKWRRSQFQPGKVGMWISKPWYMNSMVILSKWLQLETANRVEHVQHVHSLVLDSRADRLHTSQFLHSHWLLRSLQPTAVRHTPSICHAACGDGRGWTIWGAHSSHSIDAVDVVDTWCFPGVFIRLRIFEVNSVRSLWELELLWFLAGVQPAALLQKELKMEVQQWPTCQADWIW